VLDNLGYIHQRVRITCNLSNQHEITTASSSQIRYQCNQVVGEISCGYGVVIC
jgi:hypothetical protein